MENMLLRFPAIKCMGYKHASCIFYSSYAHSRYVKFSRGRSNMKIQQQAAAFKLLFFQSTILALE